MRVEFRGQVWKFGMCLQIVFVCAICGFPGVKKGSKNRSETEWSDFHHLSPLIT